MFVAICHQASDEAKITKNLGYKMLLRVPVATNRKDTVLKLKILSELYESRIPSFTGGGYFEINYSLIAGVWTYMVSNLILSLTFKTKS